MNTRRPSDKYYTMKTLREYIDMIESDVDEDTQVDDQDIVEEDGDPAEEIIRLSNEINGK